MQNVYLIDSSIYIFRYYFSSQASVLSRSGREVSTTLAFARWLVQFLLNESPEHLACFFDESLGTCFRHEIDVDYKANRSLPDEDLAYELLACKKVAELLGVKTFASERYEADDLIAASAKAVYETRRQPIVMTRDKDLGQLLRKGCGKFWDYGYAEAADYNSFHQAFGIQPKHIADYLAIAGDASDAIVGVKGIGKKTVATLFEYFDGWADLRSNLDKVPSLPLRGAASVANKLCDAVELIEHNSKLTYLACDSIAMEDLEFSKSDIDVAGVLALFGEFNAPKALIKKVNQLVL